MPQKWKGGRNAAQKRYNEKNREKRNAKKREYYQNNRDKVRESQKKYIEANMEKILAYNSNWQRKKRAEYRESVVTGYGHACICCGISETLFLEIHHPNGDGKADRKRTGGNSYTLYKI